MAALAHSSLTNSQVVRLLDRQRPGRFERFFAKLRLWRERQRQRRALAQLSPRELADFGASSADVFRELNSPVWRSLPPC